MKVVFTGGKTGGHFYPILAVATELGKKLASDGHEVHFISYAIPYRLSQFVENIFCARIATCVY